MSSQQLELFPTDAIEGDGQPKPWRLKWGVIDGGNDNDTTDDTVEPGQDAA